MGWEEFTLGEHHPRSLYGACSFITAEAAGTKQSVLVFLLKHQDSVPGVLGRGEGEESGTGLS